MNSFICIIFFISTTLFAGINCEKLKLKDCIDSYKIDNACFPVIENNCFTCKKIKYPRSFRSRDRHQIRRDKEFKFYIANKTGDPDKYSINAKVFRHISSKTSNPNFFYAESISKGMKPPPSIEENELLRDNKFDFSDSAETWSYFMYNDIKLIRSDNNIFSYDLFCSELQGLVKNDEQLSLSGNLEKIKFNNLDQYKNWPETDKNGRLVIYKETIFLDGKYIYCSLDTSNFSNNINDDLYIYCIENPDKCTSKKSAINNYFQYYLDYIQKNHPKSCLCDNGLGPKTSAECLTNIKNTNSIKCFADYKEISIDNFISLKNTLNNNSSYIQWKTQIPELFISIVKESVLASFFKFMYMTSFIGENLQYNAPINLEQLNETSSSCNKTVNTNPNPIIKDNLYEVYK